MTEPPERPSPHIQVLSATVDQEPVLANLLELYAHDFSEFYPIELAEDGRFSYRDLALYWSEPDRYPFLVRVDGKLAGLVLVKKGPEISLHENTWDMAEFFVVRAHRRHGIGTHIAHSIWRRFPGVWEIRVMETNYPGQQFWKQAIFKFTGEAISPVHLQMKGMKWQVFTFESSPGYQTPRKQT
jgi:predicted acetyltransferase